MVTLGVKGVSVNNEHKVLLCASFFYFRIPREKWEERADMIVAAGYNTVDIYFPWNWHELEPGKFRFDGDADVEAFLKLCRDKGLMIIARPGPYICSEWDGGALPAWIAAKGNLRQADPEFLADTKKWFDKILPIIKKYEYDGKGGVILLQLDNELDFFDCPDPDAYIGALRDMAKEHGIAVPYFACAGQLNAKKAGGLTSGVKPTYNFYPDSFDAGYDSVMRYYADTLKEMDLPLLISETNRDAFLLRREYAAGAKLLGAYNQIGGSNFGFTPSVNNWGSPLAFLSTQYDFESLITTLGEYSPEIDRQRIFSSFLSCLGERAAAALPYHGEVSVKSKFKSAEQPNALELDSGGVIVCVSDFDKEGDATVSACGKTVKLRMRKEESVFLPFGVKFGDITVDCANCEPFAFDGKTLVFHTDFEPMAVIDGHEVTADSEVNGIKIKFVSNETAATFGRENALGAPADHNTYDCKIFEPQSAEIDFADVEGEARPLDAAGLYRGYGEYTAEPTPGKKIFVENASDVVTAYIDGKYVDTRVVGGTCEIYPASKSGKAVFVAEKWGNSNFDDSRLPSILLSCRKGIHGIYNIESERKMRQMRFTLCEEYGKGIETRDTEPQTMIGSDKWNTTRMPAICAYSFEEKRTADKVYVYTSGNSEKCVYVNGMLVGDINYNYLDITEFCPQGKEVTVTVQYRKRQWAESVGELTVLQLSRAKTTMRIAAEQAFEKLHAAKTETVDLPHSFKAGEHLLTGFELKDSRDVYVDLRLRDCKATVTVGSRVVARVIGDWRGAPFMAGGERNIFYIPSEWTAEDKTITLFIECVGKHPAVENIKIIEKN